MASQPLISVCIPVYNNERFIAQTLDSVLAQTHPDFEVILTDDHSNDGTVAVIKRFSDSRIKLVENPKNLGMMGNFDYVLSQARGKYVKLLCGDDLIYPDCLRRQVEVLEAPGNSQVALAVCSSDVVNTQGEVVLHRRLRFPAGRIVGATLIRRCVRWGSNFIGEPEVALFRRSALNGISPFDRENPYLMDMDLWVQLLKHGDAFIDKAAMAGFRISATSVSKKLGLKQASYFRRFARKIRANPEFGVTGFDLLSGYFLSFQWCLLRNWFINFQARKNRNPKTQP